MIECSRLLAVLLLSWQATQTLAVYLPLHNYAGTTFFDNWGFYGNVDNTTWGNVTYLDKASAMGSKRLAFVNDAGNAVIRVDNTTTLLPPANPGVDVVNRDSIRLTSLHAYGVGSLIILDAVHMPYGCSVWPSFWTYGIQEEWPNAGEVDIIESINGMTNNQAALHTTPGCFKQQVGPEGQSGRTLQENCATDQGCIVAETKPNSVGAAFAQAGGGVYALQMEEDGYNIWFFSRPNLPDNLKNASPTDSIDIKSWGLPSAAYPRNDRCHLETFFKPQTLVLLTTLCGSWAGVPSIYRSTCPGSCFADNILGNGSNYANAYWEIRYVRAYISDQMASVSSGAPTNTAAGAGTGDSTSVVTSTVVVQATTDPTLRPNSAATSHIRGTGSITGLVIGLLTLIATGSCFF